MERTQLEATLTLLGWIPVRVQRLPQVWGVSHAEHGTVHEDFWHKTLGPSAAPLRYSAYATHIHEPQAAIEWAGIPDLAFERFMGELRRSGWITTT